MDAGPKRSQQKKRRVFLNSPSPPTLAAPASPPASSQQPVPQQPVPPQSAEQFKDAPPVKYIPFSQLKRQKAEPATVKSKPKKKLAYDDDDEMAIEDAVAGARRAREKAKEALPYNIDELNKMRNLAIVEAANLVVRRPPIRNENDSARSWGDRPNFKAFKKVIIPSFPCSYFIGCFWIRV